MPAATASVRQCRGLALGERDFVTRGVPVSECQRIGVLCLLVAISVAVIGCGRESRIPTAVAPPTNLARAASNRDAREQGIRETMRGRGHQHLPTRAAIAEAKGALGAVLTGEQVYYQRSGGSFIDATDSADIRIKLGVEGLDELSRQWGFSVSDASGTGFLAKARGREDSDARGIIVTLSYHTGQPIVWAVQHRTACRRRARSRPWAS